MESPVNAIESPLFTAGSRARLGVSRETTRTVVISQSAGCFGAGSGLAIGKFTA